MPKVFPVPGGTYTNDWGAPRSGGRHHEGTDIFAKRGTPVLAVADGKITAAGNDGGKGGLRIWLDGTWYYAHLNGLAKGIHVGSRVKAGQIIGYVGDSGNAKGGATHLHFGYDPKGGQSAGDSWANPFPILQQLKAGKSVDYPQQQQTTGTNTGTSVGADQEANRQASINASMDTVQTPSFAPQEGAASVGYPGSAPAIAPLKSPQVETWQALSILPNASPDTMRYLQMAQMGDGSAG